MIVKDILSEIDTFKNDESVGGVLCVKIAVEGEGWKAGEAKYVFVLFEDLAPV